VTWGTPKGLDDKSLARFTAGWPAPDRAVLEQPGQMERLIQVMRASLHQGARGPVWDMRLSVREWDFRLEGVCVPLKLFHGELDRSVPIALARKVMGRLPST
jgi:hypothetical protein